MPLRPYIVTLILLFCGLWSGGGTALASGAVSGRILMGVADYQGEVDGIEARSVSSNYQQVALRYEQKGLLGDARAGKYSLMLGYEFNRIAPSVSNFGVEDADYHEITAKKLFYQGDLLLAPGGLPFRLSLFARDIHQSNFVDEGTNNGLPVSNHVSSQGSLIDSQIYTGIDNGTHRELGGTLLIGIRNGSYLGLYRDVLSQLPRLLIDYKQIEVRDLSDDRYQTHHRSRDLAFVSLNKLDNWVHFRMRDYTDFLNPANNSTQKQVIIGLVDQLMQRRWINMTNWLRVSGDLSYTIEEGEGTVIPERTYLVNMMAMGRRQNFNTTVFSSFSRANDGLNLDVEAELPIFLTIDLDRDTRFRSRLIYAARELSLFEGSQFITPDSTDTWINTTRDCYLDLQLEMFRSRHIVVVPRFEIESRTERNEQDGVALRVGSEVYSNHQLGKTFNWLGGYALVTSRSDDEFSGESGSYLENKVYGRVDKVLDRSWRVGGNASLATGSGDGRSAMSFKIPRMTAQLTVGNGNDLEVTDSSDDSRVTRGDVTVYLEHRHQQLENRLEVSYESLAVGGDVVNQFTLRHNLDYSKASHRFKWQSVVNQGDNSGAAETINFNYLTTDVGDNSNSSASWSSKANYRYDPTRSLSLDLGGAISGTDNNEQVITYGLSEKLTYRFFTTNGIIRRIAEFSEEIGYEKSSVVDVNDRDSTLFGKFTAAYFPTRYLYGKLRSEISRYSARNLQNINGCEIGLDYEKLKLIASYTEGRKSRESEELPEVKERLWNIEMRKFF